MPNRKQALWIAGISLTMIIFAPRIIAIVRTLPVVGPVVTGVLAGV
jgi:hypothetical protein